MIEYLPSIHEAMDLISNTRKKESKREKGEGEGKREGRKEGV